MRGGSSETEAKEFAVMPCTWPGSRSTVTTVTPVAKWPRARRNSRAGSGVAGIVPHQDNIQRRSTWTRCPHKKERPDLPGRSYCACEKLPLQAHLCGGLSFLGDRKS